MIEAPRSLVALFSHSRHFIVGQSENVALWVVSLAGIVAFVYPFAISAAQISFDAQPSRSADGSLLLAIIVAGSVLIALSEVFRGSSAGSLSRSVALLGTLVAIDATLRLIPSFLGASPIFALIILVGYVFGARFGFVMGSLTLLLSAAVTAGIGPWLPFQMLCAGWIGMTAGWLPHKESRLAEVRIIAVFGAIAGLAFGALMNLYSWPLVAPGLAADVGLFWSPSLTLSQSIDRYIAFYFTTSFFHDATRALANVLLIVVAGPPTIRLLDRFRVRTTWTTPT